jgi:hypothetical protein
MIDAGPRYEAEVTLVIVILVVIVTALARGSVSGAVPSRYLATWVGDEDSGDSDFLAILDVTPHGRQSYGKVVATRPVGMKALNPHHTEHVLDPSGILFANGFAADRSFRFDLRTPTQPVLLGVIGTPTDVHYIHSFVRVPGGHVIATYQAEGAAREGAGGIAEFDQEGHFIRKSSSRVEGIEPALLRPYSLTVVPALDRLVIGCGAMVFQTSWNGPHAGELRTHLEHEHRGFHVQVFRLSDLQLLETIPLPDKNQEGRTGGSKEPRLLSDGKTVLMATGEGALFKIDHLDSRATVTRVYAFDGRAAMAVVIGKYWIQAVSTMHSLESLDVTDPAHPREASRVQLGNRLLAHWVSWDAGGHRLVVADSGAGGGETRLWMVNVDPSTGTLAVDARFRNDGAAEPGFSFNLQDWPHGSTGPAIPHGSVFVP